jgi:hypothetical protein
VRPRPRHRILLAFCRLPGTALIDQLIDERRPARRQRHKQDENFGLGGVGDANGPSRWANRLPRVDGCHSVRPKAPEHRAASADRRRQVLLHRCPAGRSTATRTTAPNRLPDKVRYRAVMTWPLALRYVLGDKGFTRAVAMAIVSTEASRSTESRRSARAFLMCYIDWRCTRTPRPRASASGAH